MICVYAIQSSDHNFPINTYLLPTELNKCLQEIQVTGAQQNSTIKTLSYYHATITVDSIVSTDVPPKKLSFDSNSVEA